MKLSRYNIEKKEDKSCLIYNTVTSAILELDTDYEKSYYEMKEGKKCSKPDLESALLEGGMLVEDDKDEFAELLIRNKIERFADSNLTLTIAPTMACNFCCPYCYEKGREYITMSETVQDQLTSQLKEKYQHIHELTVSWYGGEPLLAIETIEKLTKKIKSVLPLGCKYNADMVTNGYKLTRRVAEKLKDMDIHYIQVTLDGSKQAHDSRRILHNHQPTFEHILDNIRECADILNISIRINVDKTNINEATEIFDWLERYGLKGRVGYYLAPVDDINGVWRRGIYSKKKNVHVFGGLVICGNCGHAMTSTIRPADQDGIRWSVYVCPTKRRSEYLCKGRATSEVVLGEFVFNYILNMLNVQKNFDSINSVEDMEKMLLSGSTFRDVDGIERAGLDDLYNMLASGLTEKAPFDSSVEVRKKPIVSDIELENLNTEKTRIERAAERLQNLYLYSDDSISQKDYIIQREKLMSQLAEVNEQIGMVMSNADEKDVSDEEFVHAASKFILTQKLEGRTYIYYKRLATTVSREVLRSFVMSIIENITIYDGRVQTIVFKNDLSHTFILK